MFEALNASLLASETISQAMNSAANATEMAGDEAVQTGIEFGSLGSALDEVDNDAIGMAVGAKAAEEAVDEMGDEAMTTAAQVEALEAAMGDLDRASGSVGARLGPLSGRLGTMIALAGAAAPPLFGLASALTGVGAAGVTAAGGIGAIAFSGLQRKAENMAAASQEFEDSGEAMEAIFKNVGQEMKRALEPLKTAENTEFAMDGLEGAAELVHITAEGFADMGDELRAFGGVIGGTALETAPEIFDELDSTLTALMPSLMALSSVIGDIPSLIRFLRESAVSLQPELIGLGSSSVTAFAGISELGVTMSQVLVPPINFLLTAIGVLAGTLGALPEPLMAAAIAAGIAGAAYTWYTGTAFAATVATSGLIAAIGTLTAPISATALAIAAVVGAIVGLITMFGLWDDYISLVMAQWNALMGIIEFGIEVFAAITEVLDDIFGPLLLLMGPLGGIIWLFQNIGSIVAFVGGVFSWFGSVVNDVVSTVMGWIDTAISAIQEMIDFAVEAANAIPGVSVDFGDIQEDVDIGGGGGGDDGDDDDGSDGGPPSSPGVPAQGQSSSRSGSSPQSQQKTENKFDFRGADFSGQSSGEVKESVKEAIEEANSESRSREDAQQF